MNPPTQEVLASRWQALARRAARRVNLGWWLADLSPLLAGGAVLGCALLLYLRSTGADISWAQFWPAAAALLGVFIVIAGCRARSRFITPAQGLVRLESQLVLNNALSTAAEGKAPWPRLPERAHDGWRWNWRQLLAPWAVALSSLTLGWLVPVSTPKAAQPLPSAQPQSWNQMQEWLEKLEEEKLIAPDEKEEMKAKIDQLREEAPEKWFGHDSLQASDSLKEQMQRDMTRMAQDMNTLAQALNALKNHSETLSQAAKDKIIQDLEQTLQDLQKNDLQLHPELLKELSQLAPDQLPTLSKEQAEALRNTLKKNQQALKEMAGQNPGFLGDGEGDDDELAEMLGQMGKGPGNGGDEQDGANPGQGDVNRGPGSAPLSLAQEENDFGTNKKTGVSAQDMSRANFGDMLGLQNGTHEVDKNYQGPGRAGGTQNQGRGGEQVWRETLTPEEKAVLKKVFQ